MKVLVVMASLFAAVCAGGGDASPDRIVGGEATTIDRWPAVVQVEVIGGTTWGQGCAANVLTTRWVLSAAHCFDTDATISNRRIRAGTSTRSSGGTVHTVSRFICHPTYSSIGWNADHDGDIALAYLADAFVFSDVIQSTIILIQGTEIPDNVIVTHVGWGALYSGGPTPGVLHEVDLFSINRGTCETRYRAHPDNWLYNYRVTDNMICAGLLDVGGKDACRADSGGPLYYLNILVGIVSWRADCADATYPGVSTKVSSYTNWILENVV